MPNNTCPACGKPAKVWTGDTIRIIVCPACWWRREEALDGQELPTVRDVVGRAAIRRGCDPERHIACASKWHDLDALPGEPAGSSLLQAARLSHSDFVRRMDV